MKKNMFYSLLSILFVSSLTFLNSCESKETTPDWNEKSQSDSTTNRDAKQDAQDPKPTSDKKKTSIPSDSDSITFMYYNVRNYLTMKRGDKEHSKPEEEKLALFNNIKRGNPDILAICEIGDEKDLADFSQRLKQAGITLPHNYLTMGTDPTRRQAIFSKYPIQSHVVPKRTYTLKEKEYEVKRGILDASIETPKGTFRFIGAHLKSKRPNKYLDHNLVRRNEALIVRKHITSLLNESDTKLLVYGDLNDTKNSPSIRTIRGPYKGKLSIQPVDLRASNGSRWTQYWNYQDIYSRIDFAMFSEQMKQHIDFENSYILEVPNDDPASDHRALIVPLK